jgi:Peptidase family M28/PDZ domain
MKKTSVVFFLLMTFNSHAQQPLIKNLKKHISYLTSDKLEGRQTGSLGEQLAAQYIVQQYRDMRLVPEGDDNSYLQVFSFTPKSNPHDTLEPQITTSSKQARNVVAYLNNNAPNTVVIGAHYDHLGHAEYGNSLYAGNDKPIHNGADDNASGTAAVIEMARLLKTSASKNNNYLFVNFSGEELGLFGSKYFVEHLPKNIAPINYMINMDMVGRLHKDGGVAVNGIGTSPTFAAMFKNIKADSFSVKTSESGIGPSDHTSFYLKNYPVLFFFTGTHSDYHKPTDDIEKINFRGEALVIHYINQLIDSLDSKGKLVFTKTKNDDNKDSPKFKVTLGIMPDYVYEGKGIRVDGVSDNRPAAKAGIETGDVIMQLGKHKTDDMQLYMKALAAHKKGDTIKVKVIRNKKVKRLKLTF